MKKIFFQGKELGRIINQFHQKGLSKKRIEEILGVTFEFLDNYIVIKNKNGGDSFSEHLAVEILDAIALGFDINTALQLKDTDYVLRKINIKSYVKLNRLRTVKARLIGTKGKTKHTLENISECNIVLSDHTVGIIGSVENVEMAVHAVMSLIRGAVQSKVYSFLERSRANAKAKKFSEKELKG